MKPMVQTQLSRINRELGKNFEFFRSYYFQSPQKLPDSAFHKEFCGILHYLNEARGSKLALAAPRGSGKSSVLAEYVVYCICYKTEPFIVVLSSTSDQAAGFLDGIKHALTSNSLLMKDFPEVCEMGRRPGPPRWRNNEIITRNDIRVLALGSENQIRGRKNRDHRPGLIILDDLETDDRLQSPEQYDKLYNWFAKSVLKAGTPQTNVIFTGTIHHYHSLLAQFTSPDKNHGWKKVIWRSVMSWATHTELWQQWEQIYNKRVEHEGESGPAAAEKYFLSRRTEMLEGTKVMWPEKQDYYALMVQREDDGYASFDSEMQNEPVNPKDCYFNPEEFHYWDDVYPSEDDLLRAIGDHAEFYGACDPSLGRQGKRGDYSAIITIVKNSKDGTLYVLDADIERCKPDATIEHILAFHERRSYHRFGIESNQFQEFMASELEKRGAAKSLYPPVEKITSTSDKLGRIQTLQPLVKNGTIRFSRRHTTLLEQMKYFPKGSYDDGPDALEMVYQLCKDGNRVGLTFWQWTGPWPEDGHWVSI